MALSHEWMGFLAVFRREMIRFWRQKSRILTSFFTPFLWMAVVGSGLSGLTSVHGLAYTSYLLPGIVGMTVLFTTIFFGVSVIWEKQFGFLKEMLVAPVSRTTIFLGKAAGGVLIALIQALLVLLLAVPFGVGVSIPGAVGTLLVASLGALVFVSVGLVLGKMMDSMEGFNMVMSFLVMPAFFLSGALFPLGGLPTWAQALSYIDPLTYAVDAMRYTMLGASQLSPALDVGVLALFAVAFVALGVRMFRARS